ncbi:MAG: alpha/beta hydrolase [Solirubrobacteraceae bacterium]
MALLTLVVPLVLSPAARALDPAVEASNFSKGNERQAIYDTPQYRALLAQVSAQNQQAALAMEASDPEREYSSDLCWSGMDGCAGDVRLYDWQAKGYGIVKPVLWTARDGATISGHVWATRAGPAKRPGIVITNGSVQAPEALYWFAAQTLAKAGYVVLTWDPQGQGQSDTRGEAPDDGEGVPAQSDGRPFFDGTEDAIDFFLSTPQHPFEPRKSCSTGTSHAAKQDRRARAGLNAAYNPFWSLVDPGRLGIAGHSYGAAGVSYIGQWDPRVKAVVAWDNLSAPNASDGSRTGEQPCPADPSERTPAPITKPALGMSADYFIPPTPNTSDPDPLAKSQESLAYSRAGVDTGEIVIRGGTHYDFDFIPNVGFPATLRGADEIAWYTNAWFDKYVKGDRNADDRLLTNRWRHDDAEAAVDPGKDGNMMSFYYRSRLDITRAGGGRVTCEDLRAGCAALSDADGRPTDYSYLAIATSPDAPGAGSGVRGGSVRRRTPADLCAKTRRYVVALRGRGRLVALSVRLDGRRIRHAHGRSLRGVTLRRPSRGRHRLTLAVTSSRGRRFKTTRPLAGCRRR